MNTIDEITEKLKADPPGYGKVIRELLSASNRWLINIPAIGAARQISRALESGPFSIFYKFERTLANKLHPFLFKRGLTLLTSNRIQKQFNVKIKDYAAIMPRKGGKSEQNTDNPLLDSYLSYKNLITRMTDKDGSFMAIKFCDYVVHRENPALARLMKSIEFKINYIKNNLVDNEGANLEKIKGKFNEFKNMFSEDKAPLFTERLKWDGDLSRYSDMLDKPSEDENHFIPQSIYRYASQLREKYIDPVPEDQDESLGRILKAIEESNIRQYGPEKGRSIIHDILSIWKNDSTFSDSRRAWFTSLFNDMFGAAEPPVPAAVDEATSMLDNLDEIISETESAGISEIEENDEMDEIEITDSVTGDAIAAPGQESHIPVEEENTLLDDFEIDITEGTAEEDIELPLDDVPVPEEEYDLTEGILPGEEGDFSLTEPEDAGKGESLPVHEIEPDVMENFGEEEITVSRQDKSDDDIISELLARKREAFTGQSESLMSRIDELEEKYRFNIKEGSPSILAPRSLFTAYNSDSLTGLRPIMDAFMAKLGDDTDLFIKIIRYLEDGPFRQMTLSEKQSLLDTFIEAYRDDQKLVQQLINYRNDLRNVQSLLNEIFSTLHDMDNRYPGMSVRINNQVRYLAGILDDENYSPIWKTVLVIYENLMNQDNQGKALSIIKNISALPLQSRVELIEYFRHFYRDNRDLRKHIDDMGKAGDIAAANERFAREIQGNPLPIDVVLKQVMKEDINLKLWVRDFIRGGESESADEKEKQNLEDLRNNIRNRLKVIDWTESDENILQDDILALIKADQASAISFLENIINSVNTDPLARFNILSAYAESENNTFQQLLSLHRIIDGVESAEEKMNLIKQFRGMKQISIPEDVYDRLKSFITQEESMTRAGRDLEKNLASAADGEKEKVLKEIFRDTSYPEPLRITVKKFTDTVSGNGIEDALRIIVTSTNRPSVKIQLLQALKAMAVQKGLITADPGDETGRKVDAKIDFYRNIVETGIQEKEAYRNNRDQIMAAVREGKKIPFFELSSRSAEKTSKKKQKSADREPQDDENLSTEERIYYATENIIRAYQDNIDALDPLIDLLVGLNPDDSGVKLKSRILTVKKQNRDLLDGTWSFIQSGEVRDDIVESIYKSTPKVQYVWVSSLMKKAGTKNMEEVFRPLEKNKKLPEGIDRILKVIRSNNQNDFLRSLIEKENKLLADIAQSLSYDRLKDMRAKTRSRQDKDRISLFMELLKLVPETGFKTSPTRKEKEPVQHEKDLKKSVEKKDEGPDREYITDIVEHMQAFHTAINSKSEMVQKTSAQHVPVLNSFLKMLADGEPAAVELVNRHHRDAVQFLSGIVRKKQSSIFPHAAGAIKYALDSEIIQRSEL